MGKEKRGRKSQLDTTPGSASDSGNEKKKGKGQPKRRFSDSIPVSIESRYLAFERLVTRTRRMGAQLDREDMHVGQMNADERAIYMMYEGGTIFDFSEEEGKRAPEPVYMERHEAEEAIVRGRRLADAMYKDFSSAEYPYPEVARAARSLYGPGERESEPMPAEVLARYADATAELLRHSGQWDVDLDPSKPAPDEKR